MDNANVCLRVQDVQKRLGDFALGPLTLSVPEGSVVGLVGQNGAGKTTLIKLVLGSLLPDGGTIELFGHDVAGLDGQGFAALRSDVAYVAAECAYPHGMRAREVVRLYALAYPRFDQDAFDSYARSLEFDALGRRVSELSRGMGMKLQLACALASGARLLLLDEPTAGLDPIVRRQALDVLRRWMEAPGRSILVSSHITSDLEGFADLLALVHDGRVALVLDAPQVEAAGVARLRASELARVRDDGLVAPGTSRLIVRDLGHELLVPNRAEFSRHYPGYLCDPASIDDILVFVTKGEVI